MIEGGVFVISIPAYSCKAITRGSTGEKGDGRFVFGPWIALRSPNSTIVGIPYLAAAQSAIFCERSEARQVGTHSLVIARVIELTHNQLEVLLKISSRPMSISAFC